VINIFIIKFGPNEVQCMGLQGDLDLNYKN